MFAPPVAAQALVCDGGVAFNLPLEDAAHVVYMHGVRELDDILHVQEAAVGGVLVHLLDEGQVYEHLAVALEAYDVRVVAGYLAEGAVGAGFHRDLDVEDPLTLAVADGDGHGGEIGVELLNLLRAERGEHLQLGPGVAGDYAGRGRGLDAPAALRIGHDHALDVLDYAGARAHVHALRPRAEGLGGPGRAVGHGDGLRAAHGGDELLLEYLYVFQIYGCIKHFSLLLYRVGFALYE